jgi:hypothetical protein
MPTWCSDRSQLRALMPNKLGTCFHPVGSLRLRNVEEFLFVLEQQYIFNILQHLNNREREQ